MHASLLNISPPDIAAIFLLTLAVCALTLTLTKSSMFKWFRDLAWKAHPVIGKMSSCPYCTSHWVALVAVGVYQPRPIWLAWPADMVVSWLVIIGAAALFNGIVVLITPFVHEER